MAIRRDWGGDDWQRYALKLIQLRHGAANIQSIPDAVRGDAGIECFSTDGCLYQCYAPEETRDTAKAASAMKAKGNRDLSKLLKNKDIIRNILQTIVPRRWILLCPFLDDKEVVASVRKKGLEAKSTASDFLSPEFEALVQSQADFVAEIDALQMQSRGFSIQVAAPTSAQVVKAEGEMSARLSAKLGRAFPGQSIEIRQAAYIRAHLLRENTMEAMRAEYPTLWERTQYCLESEERKLIAVGTASTIPADALRESVDNIAKSLKSDLPHLATATITDMAVGTLSDWLFRCPLDFPDGGKT